MKMECLFSVCFLNKTRLLACLDYVVWFLSDFSFFVSPLARKQTRQREHKTKQEYFSASAVVFANRVVLIFEVGFKIVFLLQTL